MSKTHIYEVGMGSDKRRIESVSAGAAAIFYGTFCVNTNNPFMAIVYTVDGEPYADKSWWMKLKPDQAHLDFVMSRISREDIQSTRLLPSEAQS